MAIFSIASVSRSSHTKAQSVGDACRCREASKLYSVETVRSRVRGGSKKDASGVGSRYHACSQTRDATMVRVARQMPQSSTKGTRVESGRFETRDSRVETRSRCCEGGSGGDGALVFDSAREATSISVLAHSSTGRDQMEKC